MSRSFRFSVPGNLLLAGEYAVLEEGGLGWAIAVEPRLIVTSQSHSEWVIHGILPQSEVYFCLSDKPKKSDVLGQLFLALWKNFRRVDSGSLPSALITVDSRPFFDVNGHKTGLGSSAALACGLAAILARLEGRSDLLSVLHQAVQAHRVAQQGYGSGYDVSASFFGGSGLFCGGKIPDWTAKSLTNLPKFAFFAGEQSVRTPNAIAMYRKWKKKNPHLADEFLQTSNKTVQEVVKASSWPQKRLAWEACKEISLDIGEKIGIGAHLDLQKILPSIDCQSEKEKELFFKALGAGNEIGLVAGPWADWPSLSHNLRTLTIAEQGLREE